MSKSLKAALEAQRATIKSTTDYAKRIREHAKASNVDKYFRALVALEPQAELVIGAYSVRIIIPVKSMKHMLEAIEAAELVMGVEFDQTSDAAYAGERNFTSSTAWWLTIVGRVPLEATDGQTCRRVQTGVETRESPVYTLECAE